jgi:hypothetical protein
MAAELWLLGKHLSSLTVAGATRNSTTGAFTVISGTAITTSADFVRFTRTNLSEMIVAVNATKTHNEPTLLDSACSVGEIRKKYVGGAGSVLAAIADTYTYAQVTAVTGDGRTVAFLGLIGTVAEGITSVGKNGSEMSLLPVDAGATGGAVVTQA